MMGDRMTSQEIIKLLDILIGNTTPCGDSEIDEIGEENLKKLIDVVNWALDGVMFCRDARMSRFEGSVQDMTNRAEQAMGEWQVWLTENLGIRIEEDDK